MRGADPEALEEKIKKWCPPCGEGDEDDETLVKGHVSGKILIFTRIS